MEREILTSGFDVMRSRLDEIAELGFHPENAEEAIRKWEEFFSLASDFDGVMRAWLLLRRWIVAHGDKP